VTVARVVYLRTSQAFEKVGMKNPRELLKRTFFDDPPEAWTL
jgi:hypothetical protein